MSVALRLALDRDPDAALGTIATTATALVTALVAIESLVGVALAALLLRGSKLVGRRLFLCAALIVAGGALIGAFR
jgi:hypothetical protein